MPSVACLFFRTVAACCLPSMILATRPPPFTPVIATCRNRNAFALRKGCDHTAIAMPSQYDRIAIAAGWHQTRFFV